MHHKSFLALAISVLLVIGQVALADHAMRDSLQGVDDNCELCHQLDRQASALSGDHRPPDFESTAFPGDTPIIEGPSSRSPASTRARAPPVS